MRKQGMQLASKMRFIAAQFDRLLTDDLWRRNASHANRMARLLGRRVGSLPGVAITHAVESNAVFARLPPEVIPVLQARFAFYVWDAASNQVRWMTAFDTTTDDVEALADALRDALEQRA
jgi:threonine aldolase